MAGVMSIQAAERGFETIRNRSRYICIGFKVYHLSRAEEREGFSDEGRGGANKRCTHETLETLWAWHRN